MPVFEYQGKRYDVDDKYLDAFAKQYPDATIIQRRGGKNYEVRSADYGKFLKEYGNFDEPQEPPVPMRPYDQMDSAPTKEDFDFTQQPKSEPAKETKTPKAPRQGTERTSMLDNLTPDQAQRAAALVLGSERKPELGPDGKAHFVSMVGNRFDNPQDADFEDRLVQRPTPNMTLAGQILNAEKNKKRIQEQYNRRLQEIINEQAQQNGGTLSPDVFDGIQQSDPQLAAYRTAMRQLSDSVKEMKKEQKRRKGQRNAGKFFGSAWEEVSDPTNWDAGITNVKDALTMLNSDFYRNNADEDVRKAGEALMEAVYGNQQAAQEYGQNANFWERAGSTTGGMLPFMADFLTTGGGFEGIKVFTKLGGKAAAKVVGKEAIEQMAEMGLKNYVKKEGAAGLARETGNWLIKAVGATADDFLRGGLMANTRQAGATAADIINRKLGDVVEGEDGSLEFENKNSWSSAIWQGEANQTIENASELFGTHIDKVFTPETLAGVADTFGLKRMSKVLSGADATTFGKILNTTNQYLEKAGVSDYLGEVAEEYDAQVWKSVLGLNDAYQQNPDGSRTNLFLSPQFHGDIWGGLALSMGMMGAARYGGTGAAYASYKHAVNKADVKAQATFGDEWNLMKEVIDQTANENLGAFAERIMADTTLSRDEKEAIMDYAETSLRYRGFNMANLAMGRANPDGTEETQLQVAPGDRVIQSQQNESYLSGYESASPQELNDAKNQLTFQRRRVTGNLGEAAVKALDEDANAAIANYRAQMAQMNDAERSVASDNLDSMIDYANAKALYDGMMQGVRDDMDLKVTQSNELIDYQTNKADGQMHGATTRMDDHVYIIDGNVSTLEDGSIDTQNSDDSIIIRHEDGKLEMVKPDMLVSVDEPVDAETAKATAAETIRQSYAQQAAASIDGTVTSFNPGDTYTLTDDQGNQIQITLTDNGTGTADNGDGTVMATDQNGQQMRLTKDMIQQAADQTNAERTAQFEAQRQQQGAPQDVPTEELPEAPAVPEESVQEAQAPSALEQIPTDEQGNPDFERAPSPETAYDAISEMADGDTDTVQAVIEQTVAEKEKELEKAKKAKSAGGATIAEKIASETGRKSAIDAAQRSLDFWKDLAGMRQRRDEAEKARLAEERRQQEEAEAEAQRQQQEAEAQRQADEQARAREAQEQMEREAKERAEAQRKEIEQARYQAAMDKLKGQETESTEQEQAPTIGQQIEAAGTQVNTNPTPAQKEAGNYKKGHVQVGSFDITIENPAGSIRRGTDANGKEWQTEMKNTYGYIRGTEGVDGDHIDVFASNEIDDWDGHRIFVVDQYNPDGSFDEHKVMLGFNDSDDALSAYLDNYEKGWEKGRRIEISSIPASDFEKWINSSHRKTKPFAEYVNAGIESTLSAQAVKDEAPAEPEEVKSAPKSGGMHEVDLMGLLTDLKKNGSAKMSDHYVGEEKKEEKNEPYSAVLSRPYKVDPSEQNDFKKFGGIFKSVEKDIKDLAGHLIDDLGVRDLQSKYGDNSGINVQQQGIAASIGDIVVRKQGKAYDEVGVSMHLGNDENGNVGLGYAAVSVVHYDSPKGPSDITVWYAVDLKDGMTYGQFLNIIRKAIDDSKTGEKVRATIDADGNLSNVKVDSEMERQEKPAETQKEPEKPKQQENADDYKLDPTHLDLTKYTGGRNPVMHGVHYRGGRAAATDGGIVVRVKTTYPEEYEEKYVDEDGKLHREVDRTFSYVFGNEYDRRYPATDFRVDEKTFKKRLDTAQRAYGEATRIINSDNKPVVVEISDGRYMSAGYAERLADVLAHAKNARISVGIDESVNAPYVRIDGDGIDCILMGIKFNGKSNFSLAIGLDGRLRYLTDQAEEYFKEELAQTEQKWKDTKGMSEPTRKKYKRIYEAALWLTNEADKTKAYDSKAKEEKPAETRQEQGNKGISPLFPNAGQEKYSDSYKDTGLEKAMRKDAAAMANRLIKDLNVADSQISKEPDVVISEKCTKLKFSIPMHNYVTVEVRFVFSQKGDNTVQLESGSVVIDNAYGRLGQYEIIQPNFVNTLDYDKLLEVVRGNVQRYAPEGLEENSDKYKPENQGKAPKEETKPAKSETSSGYSITPTKYTTKKGKDLDMHVVRFDKELSKEQAKEAGSMARKMKGWTDYKGGYWLRSDETAREFARQMTEQLSSNTEPKPETHEGVIATANRIAQEEENKKEAERGLPENAKRLGIMNDGTLMMDVGDIVYVAGYPNRAWTVTEVDKKDNRYHLKKNDGKGDKWVYDVELVATESWYVHNANPEKESENEPVIKHRPRPIDEEDQDSVINSLRASLRKAVKHLIKDLNLPTGVDADRCVNIDYEKLRTRLEIPAGDSDLLVIDFSLDLNGGMMGGEIHIEDSKRKGYPTGLVGNIRYSELRNHAKRAIELFRQEREHETKKGKDRPIFGAYNDNTFRKFKEVSSDLARQAHYNIYKLTNDLGLYLSEKEVQNIIEADDEDSSITARIPTGEGDTLVITLYFQPAPDGIRQVGGEMYVRNQDRTRTQSETRMIGDEITYSQLLNPAKFMVEGYRKVPKEASGQELSFSPKDKQKITDYPKIVVAGVPKPGEKTETKKQTPKEMRALLETNLLQSYYEVRVDPNRKMPEEERLNYAKQHVEEDLRKQAKRIETDLNGILKGKTTVGWPLVRVTANTLSANMTALLSNGRQVYITLTISDDHEANAVKLTSGNIFTDQPGVSDHFTGNIALDDLLSRVKEVIRKDNPEVLKQEPKAEPKPNYIVSDEQMEANKAKLKAMLYGQLNSGMNPELFSVGAMLALGYIERGVRKFADYAKQMIEDIGDAIRPYLKSFYNGARDMPEAADFADEMTPYDEVRAFDTANFDKNAPKVMAAAENYAKEHEIEKQAEKIKSAESAESKENSVSSQEEKDNQKETGNGFKGTVRENGSGTAGMRDVRHGSDNASGMGKGSGQESRGSDRGGKEGGQTQRGTDSAGGLRHSGVKNSRNFRLGRGENNAPVSTDARISANIKAIELAQKIIKEERVATPEEMAALSRFSGWGGLGKVISDNEISDRLRTLVGEDGFESIKMAGNSSYFTPANVVDAMWDIARQMGFKGGNILEGSAGIGNILAHMPETISANSDIHAVEIDDTTGTILKLLYPDAMVDVQGFEKTKIANGSVDLAITNVPFVTGLHVFDETGDKKLSKQFRDIHDFCIAKNVRKLRPGGIGIFISSLSTLDKSAPLRNWITGEGDSDFIGAFRLNNETFGGTKATSDIIVVRRRINGQKSANAVDLSDTSVERRIEQRDNLPMIYNKYFIQHPENMGGQMYFGFEKNDTYRPNSVGLYRTAGKDQNALLSDFVASIRREEQGQRTKETETGFVIDLNQEGKRPGEMYIKDGKFVVAGAHGYYPLELNSNKIKGHTKEECFNAYKAIRDARDEALKYQTENDNDEGLKPLLKKLNKAFDDFVNDYGHFTKNNQITFLRNDVDYPTVAALETARETVDPKTFEKKYVYKKSDVFNGRVVGKPKESNPQSVKDGVMMSFANRGRIDLKYISDQLGIDEETLRREILENGLGFENPASKEIETPFVYLSGNVREKLSEATANNTDGIYDANVKALEKVIPIDIQPQDIEVTLGSTWIDPEIYKTYIKERTEVEIGKIANAQGKWYFDAIGWENRELNKKGGVYSRETGKWAYLTDIIMTAMKLGRIEFVKKTDEGTIRDQNSEKAANQKVEEEREEFRKWFINRIQTDPDFASNVQKVYNDKFNNYVRCVIPDEFAPTRLPGMTDKITLKPHQARAVALSIMRPSVLAHEVGAGKTYTLIAIAMELRRLGRAKKPMIVVQKSTLGQFVASAKTLYPNAKVLAYDDTKFSGAEGRKRFYSLIKYNDWDMIIIPHSTFDMIPDSDERRIAYIEQKIREKEQALSRIEDAHRRERIQAELDALNDQLSNTDEDGTVSINAPRRKMASANKEKKGKISGQNAETKAKEMLDRKVDDVENFDQMEIDALLIDEAHNYKKLGGETALEQSVKGVDLGYSKKSQGLFLKTRAVMEKNNGRNVVFATGTPISNTAAEVWNFMRYLMPDELLDEYGIRYFDDFVNNFGRIEKDFEYTTSGNLKEVTRFRGYNNLPELARLWTSVADIVLHKDLIKDNVEDMRPTVENGKPADVFLPQNPSLMAVMDYVRKCFDWYDSLSPLQRYKNRTKPGGWYSMAQGAAVDARLVWAGARDEENSKTNETVRRTLADLKETEKYRGTVAIFCDRIQNAKTGFNIFEDMKSKLVEGGVPEEQIAIITAAMTDKAKQAIFDKVNSGAIRVVMGSTATLGTGVNIQERLHMLIHMDAPNRPMDYTQRNGRIHRQGNLHKDMGIPIRILRLGIEDTLDKTAYQRLEFKASFIDSMMNVEPLLANNGTAVRVLNAEADELQNFGNTKANLSGNKYAILQSRAKKNVNALTMDRERWKMRQTYVTNTIPKKEAIIKSLEERIAEAEKSAKQIRERFPDGKAKTITIMGTKVAADSDLTDLFSEHNKKILQESKDLLREQWRSERTLNDDIEIDGLKFDVTTGIKKEYTWDTLGSKIAAKRDMKYSCPALGLENIPVKSGLIRVAVEDILQNIVTGNRQADEIEWAKGRIEENRKDIALLKEEEGKPFPKEAELLQAESDLEEYTQKMFEEQEEIDKRAASMRKSGSSMPTEILGFDPPGGMGVDFLTREGPDELPDHDETDIARMTAKVKNLAARLHLNNVRVVKSTRPLPEAKMNVRGLYDEKSGQIMIVIPNNTDVADAERTLLHEAVAHYGLRQTFGKDFDSFLSDVYDNVSEGTRKAIDAKAQENGWDTPKATEEYLASLAEDTDFKKAGNIWHRIRDFFNRMLRKLGFAVTYSDDELRYALWKSYHAMEKGVIATANDIARQKQFGTRLVSANGRSTAQYRKSLARDVYERRLKSSRYQSVEAWQDSMLGLKEAMEAIAGKQQGKHIEDIDGHENAYLGENRLSSVNKAEGDAFSRLLFTPLLDEVAKLSRNDAERDELINYMMAKHGLERNRHMRAQAVQKEFDEITKNWPEVPAEPELGDEELIDERTQLKRDLEEKYAEYDYAGLTALTGEPDAGTATEIAEDMVTAFETDNDTKDLWEKVNAVNKTVLSKQYECGLISKKLYEKIRDMYKWYIPLRGFDETVGEDAYSYLNHRESVFNSPIRRAEGRRSKADDPFANMQQMAESAIQQGNRNKLVKQKFLNFVMNHPSDLVSVSDLWIRHDDDTDEWVPVFPDLKTDDSADVITEKMQKFEKRMEELKAKDPDHFKHGSEAALMPYRIVTTRDAREHQVLVKRAGRDYVLTINGNPRAAQALNGQTNPDNKSDGVVGYIIDAADRANRYLSAVSTTFNPNFMVSNFCRDMIYANSMVWVKESPAYAMRFHRNCAKANPAAMARLLRKYQNNALDPDNETEAMFREFILNGGETGFTAARTLEQHRKDIDREIREAQGHLKARRAGELVIDSVEDLNRAVELCGRFAAFVTSRESGRSLDRAIWDAKEISVNFNKKGSGEKFMKGEDQTGAGRVAAFTSGWGRHFYIFWNAAVQGLTNYGRQAKRHPAKFAMSQAALFALGALTAALAGGGGDGDDDDKSAYRNLPDYVRRSNMLFRVGSDWLALPLSQEYRMVYGLGEIAGSLLSGREHMDTGEIAEAMMEQISQAMPLDVLEGGGGWQAAIPSAIRPLTDVLVDRSWTGMPIYNNSDYLENMPAWTKGYSNTNKYLTNLAAALNTATGGDKYHKGAVNINPAVMEYVLNSWCGGPFTIASQLTKTAETIAGQREFDPQNIPLVNRVVKAGDERTEYRAVNDEYYRLKQERDVTRQRERGYQKELNRGANVREYAEKLNFLNYSPEYVRAEIFDSYDSEIKALTAELKEAQQAGDDRAVKEIKAEINDVRKELIRETDRTRKR